jgi:beta-N-acetylhexosaminidase
VSVDSPAERLETVLSAAQAGPAGPAVALFSKILAWKGASGLPEREAAFLARLEPAAVVSLGSPYLLALVPGARFRACAFSDEPPSQRAAARALASGGPWPGRFPVRMGAP